MTRDARTEPATPPSPSSSPRGIAELPVYYKLRGSLAAGAMGEVFEVEDTRIGRNVALKTMREVVETSAELRERFEHEVRVQGQLEHPAIVPVYDLHAPDGETTFFTMRRVQGRSLRAVVDGLARGNADLEQRYGRRRLLGAFATICNAVAFAHSRGVIHRDIKPSNIMLGDYGEVYLLDWGIAHVPGMKESRVRDAAPRAGITEAGDVIGTIGYMSPEQLRGDPIDERSDVYALGATLFEILALEPLHKRDAGVASTMTLAGLSRKSYDRGRDVPPELLELCIRATTLDPSERVPDAKTMHDAVEAYLDGQRDREARHKQSVEHAARARDASLDALEGGEGAARARETALQEANRALALDPQNTDAQQVLRALVGGSGGGAYDEAELAVRTLTKATRRLLSGSASLLIGLWFAALGVMIALHATPRTSDGLIAMAGLVPAFVFLRLHSKKQTRFSSWGTLVTINLAAACSAAMLGPFLVFPSIFSANAVAWEISARPREWARKNEPGIPVMSTIATIVSVATFLVVAIFEFSGYTRSSIAWQGGDFVVLPRVLDMQQTSTMVFLVVVQALAIAAPALVVMRARDHMFAVQRRAFDAAARVRQLLPKETRAAAGDLGALADDGSPSTRATRASSRSSSSRTPKA